MKHSFWKRFLALVMAIAIVLSTGVLDSAGWLLANNGEDTTQEPTGENTTPPSDQQGGSSTETLDLTTEPTVESTGATDPSEGGETEDETTESTPVKEVTLTVVIQSVYADESQEGAVLGTEYLTYAEGEASKTIAVSIPAVDGYTFAVSGADMTLNAEGKYEASLSRPAENGMLYITVTYSPIVSEGEEGTEPETPVEGEETTEPETPVEGEETTEGEEAAALTTTIVVISADMGGVLTFEDAVYTFTWAEEETEKTVSFVVPDVEGYAYLVDSEDYISDGAGTYTGTIARPETSNTLYVEVFYRAVESVQPDEVYTPDQVTIDTYNFVVEGTTVSTQKVQGDEVVLVPEAPSKDGFKFMGWFNGETEFAQAETVTGTTYTYTAQFEEAYYLFFADEQGRVKETHLLTNGSTFDTTDHKIVLDNKNLAITGWSATQLDPNTAGTAVGEVTIQGANIVLYPITVTAFSITFDTNGGSLMDSVFYYGNQTTSAPAAGATTRPGYTFVEWQLDGTKFEFGKTLSKSIVLTAVWTESTTTEYLVVHWQENADDDGFSLFETETKTGTTGQLTAAAAKSYAGFTVITEEGNAKAWSQETIAGDGSTIVNIYYSRNVYTIKFWNNSGSSGTSYSCGKEEHTHDDYYNGYGGCYSSDYWSDPAWTLTCTKEEHTHTDACINSSSDGSLFTITAKYGANISSQWPTYNGSSLWRTSQGGRTFQANIDTMPLGGDEFWSYTSSGDTNVVPYYVEALNQDGSEGTKKSDGLYYVLHHNDSSNGTSGNSVSSEDRYPITGFTVNESLSSKNSSSYGSAEFYYTRNSYDIVFINNGKTLETKTLKYGANLADATYTPAVPDDMPEGTTFDGWYTNELLEGDKYVFEGTMPAQNITLYAKWKEPTRDAEIYFDIILETGSTTITVPYGELIEDYLPEGVNSVGELVQLKQGLTWDGQWMEIMEDGSFRAFFDINSKITRSVRIVPNITSTERFTVTYDLNGGTGSVTDSKVYYYGAYADVAYATGVTNSGYVFLGWNTAKDGTGTTYQPGDKFQVSQNTTLYAIWGLKPVTTSLTYMPNGASGSAQTITGINNNDTVEVQHPNTLGFYREGWKFLGWSRTATATSGTYQAGGNIIVGAEASSNVLYAIWEQQAFGYTVKYVWGEQEIVTTKNGTADIDTTVTENAATVSGYTLKSPTQQSLKITSDVSKNVIVFEYLKDVTFTGETAEKVYTGSEQTITGIDVSGLKTGHTYTGLKYAAKGTNVRTYNGAFSGDVVIKDANGNDVTKYYNVTKTPGKLTITKASLNLVITGNSDTKTYNGKEQEVTGFESEGLLTGHVITGLTHVAKGTNVGEYTGSFTGTVKVMDGETDVTQNYAITQNPGKLTITASSNWDLMLEGYVGVYDAQPHAVTVTPSVTEGTTISYSLDSGETWTTTAPTITDVGEVDVWVKAENPNYSTQVQVATLKVTPATLTIVTPDADKVYDGTALTAAGKIEGFVGGETATFATTGTQTAVGSSPNTYSLDWDGTAKESNYTISETIGKLTVTEYAEEIVVTTTGGTFTYDGQAHGATVSVSTLPKGYTVQTAVSTSTATDVTTGEGVFATADQLVIVNAEGKDVTKQLKIKYVDGKIVINPRSVTLTSATDSKTYDGKALTNDKVTVGGEGFVEGEGATYNVTGTITDVGSVDNAFTYTLNANTKADNYKITVNFGKLTINKVTTEIVITAVSDDKTYDGTALVNSGYTYTEGVLAEGDELTAVVEGSQTDVGTADNVVTSYKVMRGETDVTANYTFGASVKGTLTVTKRSVTLTSATDSKEYDGKALTNATVTVTGDGFATGEGATYAVTGSQLTVGSSDNEFTYTLTEGTNADNYEIKTVFGTLTVINRDAKFEITVEANSGEFKYDGTEKNVSGFKTLTFTVNGQTYTVEGLSASNTQTDAGTYTVEITGTAVVKDAAGNDVTAQFTVTEVDGKLVINKREVTLTSATDSKEYDGTALTNDEVTVSGDGFAANEGATYDVTGSQLTVGSSENEFTYTLNEGTKADNYNINKVEGTLTVTDRDAKFEIIVVANSDEFTYDGTEKNVTGFETLTFTVSGQTYTVEGLTASETQTQAGTYTVKITGTAVVKDANGNDVTAQFIVNKENGELVINPAEITVTITGNTESKVYNGSEQMVEGYEVEISNKLYTEADFSFSGTDVVKGTDVGTYPMGLAEDQFTNNNDNFTVTFVVTDGQLEITPVTDKVTVTITEHKGTEVYKGDAYTVSGYDVAISNPLYSELDIVFSGTASVSGTVVGTYDMGLKPENFANINENFTNVEFVIEDGQLVINPLEVTVTITENSDTKVYNGAEQKVEGYKVTSISNDLFKEEMIVFAGEAVAKGTVVGTYDMNLTPDQFSSSDAKNFTVTFEIVDGQLEITPVTDKVTVTITEHSGTEKYDGTEKTVTGYDVDIDNELYFEKDFTFSGNATGKGTNAGTYEMALKAADFSNISKNFTNVEFVIVDGKLEITKRSVTLTSADDEKVYDGTALTNSEVTVSGDGFVTGEGATYDVTGTQTAEGSSENEFTYTLNANTLADNYDITVEFGTLKVTALTDEIVVTITEHSGEYKYDGKEKTVSGYDVEISSKLYTEDDFTFSGDATVSGTDAGTYEMKLSPEDFTNTSKNFEKVTFVIVDGDLEINKREVTMTSATDSKVYDGTALTNDTVTVTGDGFATGEGATYDVTGSQTEFGTSSNSFTYTLNEGTKADNYIIETVEGTLTVTASQKTVTVTITENSDTVMYDGAEHSVKGYEVTGISDPLYTVNDFSFSGNATVSGTDAGTYDMELTADMFKNISTNFSNVEFEIVDGTLEITKRTVTMTSATDSKVYDGTALTNDTVTVTGDGFAENEGASYDVTGTITEVGTVENAFTYTLDEGTKADNYIIKTVEGTLTVTAVTDKVTVVITENSDTVVYDGEEHSVKGYEVTSISNPLYTVDDFTFSGNAAVNAVDAGVYDMLLTSGNFTNKSLNFANVEFVIVDGQLTINKRNVTLTSASDSKEYDGIALTAKTVEITAGSFAPNEGYTVNITGSQTLVGKSDNTFSYALTQNTKSGNYEITVVYGELQVTDRTEPFAVVVEANSGEHVYDGQPFTVSGLKEATVARMAARIDGQIVTFLLNGETYTISGLHAERTETHVNPAAPTAVDVLPYSGYEVAITGTPVITDSEGNDVTKQFTVETISGLLTIHPAPVTMVSGDATKPYDGTELINHEVTATGFVEGEGAEYAVTGTQTLVGSSENAFTYTLNEGTQAQDYRIETTFGTLTVTAPEDYEIIDKTHTTETLYRLGDTVTFDITVKNIFSEEAKVVITEQEGVSILWNGQKVQSIETTIPAGETITLQAEYTLQEKDILAGEYTNVVDANIKATVDKIPYEGDDDDDDKVDEIEDPKAKLTLDKVTTSTPANGSKYVVGETITYQITATNSGNLTLHDVVIYDLLTGESQSKYAVETDPVEYTFELDVNLAPGESATVTYTHTVTEEDLGKNLINAVTGSAGNSSETDDEEKNDTPTEIIPDEVKDPTDDIRRDLDVEKNVLNYQDPYRLGSFIEYEIVVTNRGNVTERDVIVTDIVDSRGGAYYLSFTDLGGGLLLPGNRVQIPSIAPGETVTILCHYWIGADDEALPVNNKAVVESADGETGDEDDAETVMVEKLYTLTIYYLTDDWQTVLAPEYHDRYSVGYTYYVESPEIEGYEANYKAIWSGWDGMPEHDVVCYVLYSKLPEETTEPTTEPTDPSEETTEPTTAPTEPTYDLTEIPEEEVPLGDVDLGDHTCCIMHFLIMLVAMILLGFYTKDRKKYQERIHELKRSLAAEDAAAAAAGEEQA